VDYRDLGSLHPRRLGNTARFAVACVLVLASWEILPGEENGRRRPRTAPLELLERAFRASDPGLFRTLLQGKDKIYVASPSSGVKPGYYSTDQVYFLIRDLFRVRTTLKFNLLRGIEVPPNVRHITPVARWVYREGGPGEASSAEIAFTFLQTGGAWSLKEIRDTP